MKFILPVLTAMAMNMSGSLCAQNGQSFILEYYQPSEEMAPYAQLVIESGIFDEAIADLNDFFILPVPITIVFASGIPGPQYYQGVINMPYEFLYQNDLVLSAAEYYDNPEDMIATLLNLTEFVLYHEVGHALCDVLDVPVLGKEEDAVDGFAAVLSTIWELDEVALSAADVFDATIIVQSNTEIHESEFWDAHSLSEQRMYNIFCLIYGSNPQKHPTLLEDIGMPQEQGDRCQYDFSRVYRNWGRVLEAYIRD